MMPSAMMAVSSVYVPRFKGRVVCHAMTRDEFDKMLSYLDETDVCDRVDITPKPQSKTHQLIYNANPDAVFPVVIQTAPREQITDFDRALCQGLIERGITDKTRAKCLTEKDSITKAFPCL